MLKKIFFILVSLPLFYSCNNDNTEIPDVMVDEWVYINNPSNIKLQSPGGWVYTQGGIKGIILYRVSIDKFKAYERSCPHISPNSCSFLDVEKDITTRCDCDDKEFLLATGEPINGAPSSMKEYRTYYDPLNETVHIVN